MDQHRFAHLAQRLFNVPLAITPQKAEMIVAALAQRLGITQLVRLDGSVLAFDGDYEADEAEEKQSPRGYTMVGPVAVIQVQGTLVQKLGSLRPYSGMTGYDGLRINLLTALKDSAVRGIAWDVDSPGGECAALFDLCDTIFAARREKPMCAILSENAYSAGYAIASCAPKIYVPRTGGTGSIGVICMHVDYSKWLSKEGIAVTLIQYGARKADGTQFRPLSDKALQNFQADIDMLGGMFDQLVARNRKIPSARVKSFEAGTFMGARGVAAGLADAVMAPDQAMRAFIKSL
jgi:signal peptide peptidase SppA